jgi:hypothetical protein
VEFEALRAPSDALFKGEVVPEKALPAEDEGRAILKGELPLVTLLSS